ncbi:TPA: isopentenyl phosphate kinase family protein [Candidatus Bathyarchaeota archaeon]|nr:isopentenyl phosphate kinase family protein [Candidatus Bathyarchaeota archaeon]
MNRTKTIVLKIGGSVITDKNGELSARTEVINRLSEEIAHAKTPSLIVVHGGGSFGHPTANRHAIKEGLKSESQKIGFAETHHVMTVLNGLVMDSLVWHSIPAVSVAPSSCVITEEGRIKSLDDGPLKMLLEMGFMPVLYGDVTLDEKLGFTVLSGDQLAAYLAVKFGATKIIFGVDTDGLFDSDPKINKNAKLYDHITLKQLNNIQEKLKAPTKADVTGGIYGKVVELSQAVEKGIPVEIVNAAKPNRIYKTLLGEKIQGTLIEKA